MSNINEQIEQEKARAREVCSVDGSAEECAAAWDAVEELQAEASHQRDKPVKNSLEEYCSDNPEAAECRIYDD
ncbi:MAG: Calvin cycle protein CP12 [Leptolyngbyaceae bacterium]|nr:Calvin cycle protein CP12 [Leptolyngbyaceae bacterium]